MATTQIYPGNGLEIDFLGLPIVFNDGKAENHLAIALTNNNFFGALQAQDSNIVFTRNNPISIWFVVDVEQASAAAVRHWALTTNDALHDEKVTLSAKPGNWDVRRSDDLSGNPLNDSLKGWRLTAREDVTLLPGQSLVLTLSGFTSTSPDGPTSGYVQVDMPHLDNGGNVAKSIMKVIGPITKSRIMITGERMGIGTGTPNSTLEVNGAVRARGGDPGPDDINNNGFFFDGVGDADSGMTSLEHGNLAFYANGKKLLTIQQHDDAFITEILGDLRLIEPDWGPSVGSLNVGGDATVIGDIKSTAGQVQDKWGPVMPVGAIIAYGGDIPPAGWLVCDGSALPNEEDVYDYDALRSIIGDNVPDLRDRFIVGAGNNVGLWGSTGGEAEHVLSFDEMPTHRHGMWVASNQEANNGYVGDERIQQQWYAKVGDRKGPLADPYRSGGYQDDIRAKTITEAGGGKSHNNMPPYYALTYIIKY